METASERSAPRCFPARCCGRRDFLRAAAASVGTLLPLPALAQAQPVVIRALTGEVLVNGRRVDPASRLAVGDTVYTLRGAALSFTIGTDAFFLREQTEVRLEPNRARETAINALRILTGALGATFGRGAQRNLIARTVTIGIRGTGVYVETGTEETYACTCFGSTELATGDAKMMERIPLSSVNHVARRIARGSSQAVAAPFERHTNAEIATLEALVGRPNPFPAAAK